MAHGTRYAVATPTPASTPRMMITYGGHDGWTMKSRNDTMIHQTMP